MRKLTRKKNQMLERLAEIAGDALGSEPGTTKYSIFLPREDDGKTLWVVEEYVNRSPLSEPADFARYADQNAMDLHMASQGVKDINAWMDTVPIWDAENPPILQNIQYLSPSFEFSRAIPSNVADPHVIFAELDYIPGGVATATPYWKAVVDTGRENEPGTFAYGVLSDKTKEERLCTFEVYESPEYLKDVHVPSDAISESIKNTKHLRTGLKHNLLRKVGGFLYKD